MFPAVSPQAVWGIIKIIQGHQRFKYGFLSVVGCVTLRYALWHVYKCWRTQRNIRQRKELANKRKQAAREQCTDAEIEDIMERDIEDLLNDLKSGAFTAEQVLKAFMKKALTLDKDINAITEPIVEAMDQAKNMDQTDDKKGLLYGMPVSLKENLDITGYDTTGGMAYFLNRLAKEDAVIVKVLKQHGAIPFVRTNIPQTMMSCCASNQIYGETCNPHDKSRGPGGSSSGEGALVGGGGSYMGIGSDIGGSIRVPAAFCGCYGLKPTTQRVSYKGCIQIASGRLSIQSSMCPIAKDLKSLILLSKVMMSREMYQLDPHLPCLPFNEESLNKTGPMRIGYYVFDGNIHCQPPIVRAVMEAKAALEKMGHTLVPVDISKMCPGGFDAGKMFGRLIMADRFHKYSRLLKYEKEEKVIKFIRRSLFMLPPWLMKKLGFVVSFKEKLLAQVMMGSIGFKSMPEYQDHVANFRVWQDQFMESWMAMHLDSIICPVFPIVAPKRNLQHQFTICGLYCSLYNSLNYPSGVIPVTKVTKQDVEDTMNPRVYKPSLIIEKKMLPSAVGSEGMPVAVQCVALPFQEETCLRVMREVEVGLQR